MGLVYSRQLGDVFGDAGITLNITESAFFPGKQVVLRTIVASTNSHDPTVDLLPIFVVQLTTSSGAQTTLIEDFFVTGDRADGRTFQWEGHLAFGLADVLQLIVNNTGDPLVVVNVVASGYLLALP